MIERTAVVLYTVSRAVGRLTGSNPDRDMGIGDEKSASVYRSREVAIAIAASASVKAERVRRLIADFDAGPKSASERLPFMSPKPVSGPLVLQRAHPVNECNGDVTPAIWVCYSRRCTISDIRITPFSAAVATGTRGFSRERRRRIGGLLGACPKR